MKWYKVTHSRAAYCLIIMRRWWKSGFGIATWADEMCIYSLFMRGGLVANCFHSIRQFGWKRCVDGWNVTQTERRALKEHINILACVRRERRGERGRAVCVLAGESALSHACMWGKGVVSAGEMNVCVRAGAVCKCWWTAPCYTGVIDFLTLGYSLGM